jgi:excisionase family DNA binding protein
MGTQPPKPNTEPRPEKPTLTSGQAAALLGIPARTVRRYLITGKLKGKQNPITGRWTVERTDVQEFLAQYQAKSPSEAA